MISQTPNQRSPRLSSLRSLCSLRLSRADRRLVSSAETKRSQNVYIQMEQGRGIKRFREPERERARLCRPGDARPITIYISDECTGPRCPCREPLGRTGFVYSRRDVACILGAHNARRFVRRDLQIGIRDSDSEPRKRA